MNQFLVPQFIDVEPKIIAGLNLRQFIFIVIGIVLTVFSYKYADIPLFILEFIVIASTTILVGFIKINGREFHFFFLDIMGFSFGSNIRVWKKEPLMRFALEAGDVVAESAINEKEMIRGNKLSELSLLLDTGGAYKTDENAVDDSEEEEIIK